VAQTLKGVKVAILATDGFEQSELLEPRRALDEAGAKTEVVSLKTGNIKGWNHKEWGESVTKCWRVDREAVVDGNLVTSRNPNDIPAFNREIAKLFASASG
jgi:putative intracellular protease/amidase